MVWLLEGCFDGEGTKPFSKLLKPHAKYTFGRKEPADVIIKSKLVSQESGNITTGLFKIDDVSDVGSRPSVEITAGKKGVRIVPADEVQRWEGNAEGYVGIALQAGETRMLHENDLIVFTNRLPLGLRWSPCAFSVSRDCKLEQSEVLPMCAANGIHAVVAKNVVAGCNYYVTGKAGLTVPLLLALSTAMSVVTPAFLTRLLGTASLPRLDEESLERDFHLLDPYEFQPPLSDDLLQPEALGENADLDTVLIADHRRPNLLKGITILFVLAGSGEAPLQSMLAERVGATTETVSSESPDFASDRALGQLITNYKEQAQSHLDALKATNTWITHASGLVILVEGTAAVGDTEWFQRLARVSLSLQVAMPLDGATCVTRAILQSSVEQILFRQPVEALHSVPQLESVSRSEGPATQAPASKAQIDSNVADPEQEETGFPLPDATESSAPKAPEGDAPSIEKFPRRPLKRRAGQRLDAASALDHLLGPECSAGHAKPTQDKASAPRDVSSSAAPGRATEAPAPYTGSSSRLKRRAATARTSDVWDLAFGGPSAPPAGVADVAASYASGSLALNTQGELKSKRFRMHLNESDAQETEQQAQPVLESNATSRAGEAQQASQTGRDTQSVAPSGRKRPRAPDPPSPQAAGEDSEPTIAAGSEDAGRRKRPTNDVERARTGASREARGTSAHEVQSLYIRETADTTGIAPGQRPDRDETFLQALSTGRGKKKLDKFDEEFNKLRIARPQYAGGSLANTHFVNQEEAEDEMYEAFKIARLDELDDLFSVNHGNFVAVDFVPLIKRRDQRPASTTFDGIPNFKKFRQVNRPKRTPIALETPDGGDELFAEPAVRNANRQRAPSGDARHPTATRVSGQNMDEEMSVPTLGTASRPKSKPKSIFAALSDEDDEEEPRAAGSRRQTASSGRRNQLSSAAHQNDRNKTLRVLHEDGEDADAVEEQEGEGAEDAVTPEPDLRLDDDWEYAGADAFDTSVASHSRKGSGRAAAFGSSKHGQYEDDPDGDSTMFAGFKRARRVPSSTASSKRARR